MADAAPRPPILEVRGLDVYYGRSHALQGVDLTLAVRRAVRRRPQRHGQDDAVQDDHGPRSRDRRLGAARRRGHHQLRAGAASPGSASAMCRRGAGCGARSPSTSICSMTAGMRRGAWTVERIYETFPRLAERRNNGGGQLSGGEQQMLAISRALLTNPQAAGDGRADRGARAGHRRAGRGDAGPARRGGRHFRARHRAEHRRRDGGRE